MPARKKTTVPESIVEDEPVVEIELDAEPDEAEYTVLISPTGHETTVPESIVESLLDSGYTKA